MENTLTTNNNLDLNKKEIISEIENNMREKLVYIPLRQSFMEVTILGENIPAVNSSYPSDTFNASYGGTITKESAVKIKEYYKNNKLPMAWWIGPNSQQSDTDANLLNAGFIHDEHDVGMWCDLESMDKKSACPDELKIKICHNAQDFIDFGEVLASIFDPVDEYVKTFYKQLSLIAPENRKDLILFVGFVNGKPVATSGLFLTNVAGIYDISTRPECRNKGYGTAMFYAALQEAKKRKFKSGILQASPDGLNIYKRFGYIEICDFNVWSNKNHLLNEV